MNLGIERFLILGCIAVLILELPQLFTDLELGDGFPATSPVATPVVVVVAEVPEPAAPVLMVLEGDVLAEAVELPSVPGL